MFFVLTSTPPNRRQLLLRHDNTTPCSACHTSVSHTQCDHFFTTILLAGYRDSNYQRPRPLCIFILLRRSFTGIWLSELIHAACYCIGQLPPPLTMGCSTDYAAIRIFLVSCTTTLLQTSPHHSMTNLRFATPLALLRRRLDLIEEEMINTTV